MNKKRISEIVEIYMKGQSEEVKELARIIANNVEMETREEAVSKVYEAISKINN